MINYLAIVSFVCSECYFSNTWNRRVDLSTRDFVVFYAHNSVYHYISNAENQAEGWSAMMENNYHPRYAYRGMWLTGTKLDQGESQAVDHIIFMVHGVGEVCDFSFRKLIDVVDDFRSLTYEMLGTHYSNESVGRVEVLPVSWHQALHTEHLDAHLKLLSLPSIPKMRSFMNDTIMDALFYTSTTHSQAILNAVALELNRLFSLFVSRNPGFIGTCALGGHSLGSLICFDLLSHQAKDPSDPNLTKYPNEQIQFKPVCLFALGSPIPVFLSVRGINQIDDNFQLPTCPAFYHIFHPYDPIAYRLEPLLNTEFAKLKPMLIPYHKGRKRLHYMVRDSFAKMGTDLKQRVLGSLKYTLNSLYDFAVAHKPQLENQNAQEEQSMQTEQTVEPTQQASVESASSVSSQSSESPSRHVSSYPHSLQNIVSSSACTSIESPTTEQPPVDPELTKISQYSFGKLNSGRRVDYVLQERPIEVINEYLFAIASHCCYWLSEDTALLMLRELYGQMDPRYGLWWSESRDDQQSVAPPANIPKRQHQQENVQNQEFSPAQTPVSVGHSSMSYGHHSNVPY